MSAEENKQIVRRYREIHNRGNLDELDQIVARDLLSHTAFPGLPPGLEGGKLAHKSFMAGFPDTVTTTQELIAEGDRVVERYTSSGTNTGPFMGAPATGKKYSIESIAVYRIANGKIVEHWGLDDGVTLMMQLGLMPAPAQPSK